MIGSLLTLVAVLTFAIRRAVRRAEAFDAAAAAAASPTAG